jgi:hypothetical protein
VCKKEEEGDEMIPEGCLYGRNPVPDNSGDKKMKQFIASCCFFIVALIVLGVLIAYNF